MNVVTDLSRAVARLNEHADTPDKGVKVIDGLEWTRDELRASVADSLAVVIGSNVRLRKVSARDCALMLSAHGADPFMLEMHARAIARLVRADMARGSWSAWV